MKIAAVIAARAGSKRLPGKNIIPLGGIPLLAWSVRAAAEYGGFSDIVISSDSREYCNIAVEHGATTAMVRNASLATDQTTSADVLDDILARARADGRNWDAFVLLQPTSPFRTADDIAAALQLFQERQPDAVVSVCPTECPIEWTGRLGPDLELSEIVESARSASRSQDLAPSYRLNGAIYVLPTEVFAAKRSFVPEGSIAYVMPRERSIDIDTEFDLRIAEELLRAGRAPS